MEGLAAIGQRIAEIQSLVADPALAVSATSTGTSTGNAFAAALADALLADGTTSASGTSATDTLLGYGTTSGALAGYGASGSYGSSDTSVASLLGALGLSGSSNASSLLSALGYSDTSSALSALGVPGVSSASSARSAGGTTASTALTADGIPVALAAYGNGHVPASALEQVGTTGSSMWAPAAESLERLIAAAKADGITIGVTEGYRSYDEQVSLAKTKGLYSEGGLAAVPGTSEHGWGMAADLKLDSAGLAWMRAHASEYGFYATAPRESWHWGYKPNG